LIWDPDDKERTAFHEAGHAVVAWSFGVVVHRVRLNLEKQNGNAFADPAAAEKLALVEQIAIALAGYASESICIKPPARFLRLWRQRRKAKAVHDLLTSIPEIFRRHDIEDERERRSACRRGGVCSKKRLREHEAKVRRVARQLLKHHDIDRDAFEALMAEA
jgi:ATP-dependent Zn protease